MTLVQELNDLTAALATDINTLEDAIGAGSPTTLDDLTDTTVASYAAGRILRANGSAFVDVLGSDHFQPKDADLDALVALTQTAYGRALLELANQAALMALLADGTTTVKGILELATDAEAIAGSDTSRAVTAANLAALLTDRIDTNVALGASNTKVPSQAAVKAYADALIAANDAMVFKGVIDASTNPNYPAANKGDTYKISVAGKIGGASGPNVEIGDTIISTADGQSAGTHAAVGANWGIVQGNLDGVVIGPAAATSGNLPAFSGTSGKLVADSGFAPSNGAIGAGSATVLPTSGAVKTALDAKQDEADIGDTATDFAALYASLRA
jgi:hypothetical protein